MRSSFFRAIIALGVALPAPAQAQSVSVTGGAPQTQTFDTLLSTGTGSTPMPTGWFLLESGSNANATYTADTGGASAGNTYSYGAAASTERAFGGLLSGSLVPTIGARLQNDTAATLTQLQVEYDGEQWRLGATGRTDRLDFQYSVNATGLGNGTWIDVDALDFAAPVASGTVGALDGNANTANRSSVISGLSLASGATIWVRWTDLNATGADDGLAIDNVVFSIPGDSPPALGSTVPAAGASAVARDQTITLNFTEPVTTSGAWYALVCATSGTHAAVVSGTGASRTIDPDVDFAFDEDCTLTLDPALILDQDPPADPLAGDTRLSFRTAVQPVDVAPTVASFNPANGAGNVAVSSPIVVKFSEAVTVGANWYTLTCTTSGAHAATFTADTPSQFTVNPDVDFGYVESCTFTVNGAQVTDQDGTADPVAGTPATTFTTSAAPGAYYGGVDTASCQAIRTTLHRTIDDHTAYPYTHATLDDTWTILEQADQDPLDSGRVLEVYENVAYAKAGGGNTNYNREHTWPNSYGFNNLSGTSGSGVPVSSAYTDTHMLYLSDIEYNSDRGSKPYATCSAGCAINATQAYNGFGGGAQTYPGNHNWYATAGSESQGSYEVWNHRRGDIARAVLYMDIRYEGGTATGGNTVGQAEPDLVVTDNRTLIGNSASTTGGTAYMGLKATLVAWHDSDPPDTHELLRNDVVSTYQGNRNPFIDNPQWSAIAFAEPCLAAGVPTGGSLATPASVAVGGFSLLTVDLTPATGPVSTGITVTGDLTSINGSATQPFSDDGNNGDAVAGDKRYTYNAFAFAAPGAKTLPVTIADAQGRSSTDTIALTLVDAPPVANDDADSALEDVATWLDVLTNDGNPDGGPKTIVGFTQPANGTVTAGGIGGLGDLTYTSNANFCSATPESFGYTLNGGDTATVSVTVLCVNDAPSFTRGPDATIDEDAGARTLAGWATNVSAGPPNESGQAVSFNVSSNSNPALFAAGPAVAANGTLTFTPAADASGSATITLFVADDGGTTNGGRQFSSSQSFVVTVNPVNDAPSFTRGADQSVSTSAGAQAIAGWASAISAGPNESAQAVSFEVTGNTNPSLFSAGPAVAPNGTLSYAPAANANGSATITLRARDDGGTANGGVDASPTQSFTIAFTQAPNQAANADDDAPSAVLEDATATTFAVLANDSDPENDPFAVTAVTQPANGTAAIGPAGANVTFTPAANFCGATSFTYTVTGGDTATVNVAVTCVNDAPVAADANGAVAANSGAGTPVATVTATDVDGPALGYAITGGNTGNAFAIAPSGAITVATPAAVTPGTFTLAVTVSDGALSDTATVTVVVSAPPPDAMFANGFE